MKLTYWIAKQHADHECYDIVARTRKECIAQMVAHGGAYDAPQKLTLWYDDAFHLFDQLTSEGGGRRAGY